MYVGHIIIKLTLDLIFHAAFRFSALPLFLFRIVASGSDVLLLCSRHVGNAPVGARCLGYDMETQVVAIASV